MSDIDRVIVTGASSGIGFDIARRFLEAGSRVLLNGRDEAKLARAVDQLSAHAERVFAVAGDIGDPETGRRLAEAAQQRLGGVDVLVNNAGIFGSSRSSRAPPPTSTRSTPRTSEGTFLVTQALVPLLIEAGGRLRHQRRHGAGRAADAGAAVLRGDGQQGRRPRAHPLAGGRARAAPHPGQRDRAGHHPHAADRRRRRLAGRLHPLNRIGRGRRHQPRRRCTSRARASSPAPSSTSTAATPMAAEPSHVRLYGLQVWTRSCTGATAKG